MTYYLLDVRHSSEKTKPSELGCKTQTSSLDIDISDAHHLSEIFFLKYFLIYLSGTYISVLFAFLYFQPTTISKEGFSFVANVRSSPSLFYDTLKEKNSVYLPSSVSKSIKSKSLATCHHLASPYNLTTLLFSHFWHTSCKKKMKFADDDPTIEIAKQLIDE